jgi:holliday junction DNA helicase RuvB
MELLDIDACGFDNMGRAILAAIIDKFDGGSAGLETLAATLAEESDTIGDFYASHLLQVFIARTARSCPISPADVLSGNGVMISRSCSNL